MDNSENSEDTCLTPSPQLKATAENVGLLSIPHYPLTCPIDTCQEAIGSTSILSHYIHCHHAKFGMQYEEVYGDRRVLLKFDHKELKFMKNECLGLLLYGGMKEDSKNLPANREICFHNSFLPQGSNHLRGHLPIFIMACWTSWEAVVSPKRFQTNLTAPTDKSQNLLLLWLTSVQTLKPVYGTITAFSNTLATSRSAIIPIRFINDTQNPSIFYEMNRNYLRLNQGDINFMSHNDTEEIHLEIVIMEYE